MTFIKPKDKKSYRRFFLIFCLVVLLCGSAYIYEYNSLVALRYDVATAKTSVIELKEANNELTNALYAVIDPLNLEKAMGDSLTLDTSPEYLGSY